MTDTYTASGNISISELPSRFTNPVSELSSISQLNEIFLSTGNLVLKNCKLVLDTEARELVEDYFISCNTLTLSKSLVFVGEGRLTIIAKEINCDEDSEFLAHEKKSPESNRTVSPEYSVEHGSDGLNAGDISIYLTQRIKKPFKISLVGQDGAKGPNGLIGKPGPPGKQGRGARNGEFGSCRRGQGPGRPGGRGEQGGPGGDGGDGGDGGNLRLNYINTQPPSTLPVKFDPSGGEGGVGGQGGEGGAGGRGGAPGRCAGNCSCMRPPRGVGAIGPKGPSGSEGTTGQAGAAGFIATQTITLPI